LDHLSRPSSAASSRPRSAASRPPSQQRTMSRPQSADPRIAKSAAFRATNSTDPRFTTQNSLREGVPTWQKTQLQKAIDGDTGPPMLGISGMAVTTIEKIYREEFEGVMAASCDHPYVSTTAWNRGSVPHNLLTGSALSPNFFSMKPPPGTRGRDQWQPVWASEYNIRYYPRSSKEQRVANDPLLAVGVRSEQMRYLG